MPQTKKTLATGLPQSSETVHQELNAAMFKTVEDTTRVRQAVSAIRRATHPTLESGLFYGHISQNIVKDHAVVKLFPT